MKSANKLSRLTGTRSTYKTKDDFLRWLKVQKARKKQTAKEQIAQGTHTTSHALMVWADDGGTVG